MRNVDWLVALALVVPAIACSTTSSNGGDGGAAAAGGAGTGGTGGEEPIGGEPAWRVMSGSGGCDSVLYEVPVVGSPHVEDCSQVNYLSNPPTSGPHYPKWANYVVYGSTVPWGFLVHAMEHGGVVLSYDCTDCDADIAAMTTYVEGREADPACTSVNSRVILVPQPSLDVPFAVSAWGQMLKAQCFDEALVSAFIDDNYGNGPEDLCGAGIDPLDPIHEFPADCGE
jgi:hypothetical protein